MIPLVGDEGRVVGLEETGGEFVFTQFGEQGRETIAGVESGEPVLEPALVEKIGLRFTDEMVVNFDEARPVCDAMEKADLAGRVVWEKEVPRFCLFLDERSGNGDAAFSEGREGFENVFKSARVGICCGGEGGGGEAGAL